MKFEIPKNVQVNILDDASDYIANGRVPAVTTLCQMHFGQKTKRQRIAVAELLDRHGVPRLKISGRQGLASDAATSPSDFGVKFEAMSRVFVGVSSPDDVDLYLVERAKAGNARAMEILKKLVG